MPRDSAGNYSLVAGNPVQSGEVVSSSWANNTLDDVAVALSDSLDRNGRGGMLAPFRFSDGTNLLPGAAWTNETTTGLYRFDGGDLRLAVLTQDVMRWQTTGVQIWDDTLMQWDNVLTDGGAGQVPVDAGTADYQTLVWDETTDQAWKATAVLNVDFDNSNVGIGTDAPEVNLDVVKASSGRAWTPNPSVGLIVENSSNSFIDVVSGNTSQGRINFGDTDSETRGQLRYDHSDDSLQFRAAGLERVRITATGDVGIATTTPTALLDVQNAAPVNNSVNPAIALTAGNGTGSSLISYVRGGAGTEAGMAFDVATGGVLSEAMRINPNGNLSIGTLTTPNRRLEVASDADQVARFTSNDPTIAILGIQSTTDTTAALRFYNAGNTARGRIQYDFTDNYMAFFTSSGNERMRISADGVAGVWNDFGTVNNSSTFQKLTQAQYDGITPDSNTIYFIVG